ncbi:hypothetical protein HQ403_01880 [Candidatus Kaiserbacteria bacterium]|nr:hypothetical protein [Candidatus Kaiserbacteria bacterium]
MINLKNKEGIVLLLVSIIIIFFLFIVNSPQDFKLDTSISDYSKLESTFEKRMEDVGGKKLFEEIIFFAELLDPSIKHLYGHIFGKVLYEKEGLGSFLICDSRLQQGCIHEFIGNAIVDLGIESVTILNDTCLGLQGRQEVQACQHGIGHGLVSHFGYSESDLLRALSVCRTLPTHDSGQMFGCYGGVFMEHNVKTMLAEETDIRHSEDLFEPCRSLDDVYKSACSFWQPQWWRQEHLSHLDPLSAYARMGSYCSDLSKEPHLINVCFLGMGNLLPIDANLDSALAVRMCDAGSDVFDYRMSCRKRAGRDFSEERHTSKLELVCAEMSDTDYRRCVSWLEGSVNDAN